uniref:Corrinoid adenosyltransferase MMAB n=1 Tax=Stygiella incarcerata TaxID=1712417 RepID=A0A192ZIV2_9EUKA|nr:cobyrinic acid ac-diamide adenosyltransferase [Stygiella incarcerata]
MLSSSRRSLVLPFLGRLDMSVYTRTGDKGSSSLFTGERRRKDDAVFQALGNTDELNSILGICAEFCGINGLEDLQEKIIVTQSKLIDAMSAIATPPKSATDAKLKRVNFGEEHTIFLEKWIDGLERDVPPLKQFIVPSGGIAATHLHLARSICRRAERSIVPLILEENIPQNVGKFINRLSDFLFVAARYASMKNGRKELPYKKEE